MNQVGRIQYLQKFSHSTKKVDQASDPDQSIRRAALDEARENRKFEIEMYWKRATYFWAFIAAAFAGYFLLQKPSENGVTSSPFTSYVIACLGFVFSLAWYFVNRGSKYWQQNWETHVDLLEDEFSGPIYKTIVHPSEYRFFELDGAFPFSVSKINQILSLFVTLVWFVLIARGFAIEWNIQPPVQHLTMIVVSLVTLLTVIALRCIGKTEGSGGNVEIIKNF